MKAALPTRTLTLYFQLNDRLKKMAYKLVQYVIYFDQGGAGSEAWNRVYMIAPVKQFGRVGLSTNFYSKQTWRWWRRRSSLYLAYVCLCRFSIILALPSLNIQGKVSIAFFTFLIWFCCLFCFICYWFTTSFEAFSDIFHIRLSLKLRIDARDFVHLT